jgi:hypothetical protein
MTASLRGTRCRGGAAAGTRPVAAALALALAGLLFQCGVGWVDAADAASDLATPAGLALCTMPCTLIPENPNPYNPSTHDTEPLNPLDLESYSLNTQSKSLQPHNPQTLDPQTFTPKPSQPLLNPQPQTLNPES